MRTVLLKLFVVLTVSLSTAGALAQQPGLSPLPSGGGDLGDRDWYGNTVRSSSGSQTHHSEPRVIKKGPLAPSDEDRAINAVFLTQPHTGLMRLLPRQNNQQKNGDGSVKMRGGGAYYSFAFLSHEYGFGSDLELSTTSRFMIGSPRDDDSDTDPESGTAPRSPIRLPATHEFSVGFAGADYGMMTTVSDVDLEEITMADPRVRFMSGYRPPRVEPAARAEALAFRQGRLVDLQLYRSRQPIQLNLTYLLRSIVYRESDVLVAFRVVRQDTDGSVTIAWKLLKQFPTPELARN